MADTPSDVARSLNVAANVIIPSSNPALNEETPQKIWDGFHKKYDKHCPQIRNLGLEEFVLFVRAMNQAISVSNPKLISLQPERGFYDHLVLWYARYCKTDFKEATPDYGNLSNDRASSWVQAANIFETNSRTHNHDENPLCPACDGKTEVNNMSQEVHVLDAKRVKTISECDLDKL